MIKYFASLVIGTATIAENIDIELENFEIIKEFIIKNKIDFIIIVRKNIY